MRRCTMMAHLRLMTLSLMVMPACRRASRRPSNAARSCARRGPARNVLFCLQTLKNGILTHPSFWEDYCNITVEMSIFQRLSDDMATSVDCGWLDGLMPLEHCPL